MKKISLKENIKINGYGVIFKDTQFKVIKFNKRFVYIEINNCECKLSRNNVNIIY